MPQRGGRFKSGKSIHAGNAAASPELTGVETQPGSNGVKGSLMNTFGSWGSSATQSRVRHCKPQIPGPFYATRQLDIEHCLSPPPFIAIGRVSTEPDSYLGPVVGFVITCPQIVLAPGHARLSLNPPMLQGALLE